LSVKRFSDVELHEIDARLAKLADWRSRPARELGESLGCDALVYGTVGGRGRVYLGIYSQISLEGEVRLVDVATHQPLVEASHTSTFHAGGLPLSPGGVIFSALGSLQNMSDQQLARAIDDLGLNLAEKIPELPTRTGASLVGSAHPGTRTVPQTDPHEEAGVTQGTDGANSMEASARSASTGPRGYRVQVASFRSLGDANRAVQVIFDKGYGQYSPAISKFIKGNQLWYRVLLGPFSSAKDALHVKGRIEETLPFSPILRSPKGS
jgi:cell division septation protein DedD